jgi:hypothetical protein
MKQKKSKREHLPFFTISTLTIANANTVKDTELMCAKKTNVYLSRINLGNTVSPGPYKISLHIVYCCFSTTASLYN